jgi:hypothetical protein
MKKGIVQCPICQGLGSIRYKIWHTSTILEKILEIKENEPYESEDELPLIIEIMKIECPLCQGDGIFDWIKNITRGDIKKKFKPLEGNMDIFYSILRSNWSSDFPKPYVEMKEIYLKNLICYLEKLIEMSKMRYRGIKLNKRILSMSYDELDDLCNSGVFSYLEDFRQVSDDEVNKDKIRMLMITAGLSDYIPDKFALPWF